MEKKTAHVNPILTILRYPREIGAAVRWRGLTGREPHSCVIRPKQYRDDAYGRAVSMREIFVTAMQIFLNCRKSPLSMSVTAL